MKEILKWFFGIMSVLFALVAFKYSMITTVLFLVSAVFLIPPIFKKLNEKVKIERWVKITVPIAGVFTALLIFGNQVDEIEKIDLAETQKKQKEEYENMTQQQKDNLVIIQKMNDSIEIAERTRKQKENTVSAKSLYANYKANEVNADEIFKGKTFYVTGKVVDIKKDFLDNIYVTLNTSEYLSSVQCFIDDKTQTSKLKKGQEITVYGKCKGFMVLNVIMKDCKLIKF